MTAITTYATLKSNILEFFKRTDNQSMLDVFIDSCEEDIWNELRVREMEARATASTSTADRFLQLPTGYIKMRQMQITIDSELFDIDEKPLKEMVITSTAGVPTQFTITSQIEFNCPSDTAYTVEMDYWRSLTALSSSNTSNDVLTNYPNIYLFGCLKHAFTWSQQFELANYWEGKFNAQIAKANRKSRHGRYGPSPQMSMKRGLVV